MNWEAISALGEVVGALAVLVTLLYLASQLRQNTQSAQNATWHSVIEMLSRFDVTEATDPSLVTFIRTAEDSPDAVSEEEYWRFTKLAAARIGTLEYAFLSSRRGSIDGYYWDALRPYLRSLMSRPGYQKYWRENKSMNYHPEFIVHLDAVVDEAMADRSRD